jgi:nitrite reductase/ring-hydroxylating ferredoxin subunit
MSSRVVLCALADLPDGASRAFAVGEGDWPLRGFLVRQGERVVGYVNRCPHAGHPLNWRPDDFLTPDRTLIMCRSHGALFDISSGRCVAGPCAGQSLRELPVHVENELVILEQSDELERLI